MNNLPIFSASRFALISTGLAGAILCASMLGLPRAAQAQNLNTLEVAQAEPEQAGQKPGKTIPADSALVVRFCAPVTLNTKNKSSLVNAALAQPLLDSNGRIAVPVNTLVGVQLKPTAEGAEITANNLVVGSRYLPVQTSSVSIPLEIQVQEKSSSRENNRQGTVSNLARGAQAILSQQGVVNQSTGDFLGAGLSILSGITRKSNKPKVIKTIEVPQGSTFVLPFSSAVTLPAIASKAASNQTVCSTNTGATDVDPDLEEDTDTEEEAETTEAALESESEIDSQETDATADSATDPDDFEEEVK